MQIASPEIHYVAVAEAARFDMYSGIHKALRAAMADALLAVGRVDPFDDAEVAQMGERVHQLLALCGSHVVHENGFVHAAIEARAPGASGPVAREHEEHCRELAQLAQRLNAFVAADPGERVNAGASLYRALALFIAANFEHMHLEETAHNALLWAHYSDAELVAIHDHLLASIPAEDMMVIARWLLPALPPQERALMLADMRAKAPAPAFTAMLDLARASLGQRDWRKLERALDLGEAVAA